MKHISEADHQRRRDLYDQGLSDDQIAKTIGAKRQTIQSWRNRQGLKPSRLGLKSCLGPLSPEASAARMLLYQMRYSDRRIAREQGVGCSTVQRWRQRRGLAPNDLNTGNWRYADLTRDTALDRIKRAIGRRLPADIADDAVGDLYMAVLTGAVQLDKIEAEARKFGNRVLNNFASKFGPRSLDEEIADSEGFTLLDTLVDERSSDWLEEMGATVW